MILGCTWEWGLASGVFSLTNGGTAGAIWMFLVVCFGMFFVMLSFAEAASIAPTSGGQYRMFQRTASSGCRSMANIRQTGSVSSVHGGTRKASATLRDGAYADHDGGCGTLEGSTDVAKVRTLGLADLAGRHRIRGGPAIRSHGRSQQPELRDQGMVSDSQPSCI